MDPDDRPKPKPAIVLGEDLALLSVDELEARIAALKAEIARVEQAVAAKRASRDQAAAVFRL